MVYEESIESFVGFKLEGRGGGIPAKGNKGIIGRRAQKKQRDVRLHGQEYGRLWMC